jgi:integrase
MRVKAIFTVFGRKLPSGKRVYYYQCYDANGKRQWAKSTGITKKTEAVAYCMKLFKDGLLVPDVAEFSAGWWDVETCGYLKWRRLHEPIADTTLCLHKGHFENHIKGYFAKYRLDEITPEVIEGWLLHMSEKKEMGNKKDENKKTLKPKTVNLAYGTLKLMMGEAARTKLLKENPCREVKELKEETIKREILTVEEVKKLFPLDWQRVWGSGLMYKANRLAACTGLRIGELRGLRGEYVFDDYIFITGQYTRFGYKNNTKTKENRNIPVTPVMRQELEGLLQANGNGYVFSDDGGETPVSVDRIRKQFDRALKAIGIGRAEKMERNLSFHAWRHFLNTLLRMSNVADSKVQSVTGHRSLAMTDHYTHFDTRKFAEVRDVQTELLALGKPENTEAKEKVTA